MFVVGGALIVALLYAGNVGLPTWELPDEIGLKSAPTTGAPGDEDAEVGTALGKSGFGGPWPGGPPIMCGGPIICILEKFTD